MRAGTELDQLCPVDLPFYANNGFSYKANETEFHDSGIRQILKPSHPHRSKRDFTGSGRAATTLLTSVAEHAGSSLGIHMRHEDATIC